MKRLIVGFFVLAAAVTVVAVDGPLTNFMSLAGRTNSSGYLMVSGNGVTGVDGPLTAMANLATRTDASGYLMVSMPSMSVPAIATTSTDGFSILNSTAATSGVPVQMSPRLKWCGAAYNSTSTLSETDCMFAEVLPATVAGTTTQTWKLGSSINGAAANYPFTVDNQGSGTLAALNVGNGSVNITTANTGLRSSGSGVKLVPLQASEMMVLQNNGNTIGNTFKVDALPTVSACGAGSPAVVAGSTPLSGSVTIGTTAVATCTITFNGTAFPSAPACTGSVQTTTAANARAMGYSATTTALTIVPSAAWADSSVVNWTCLSAK